MRREGAPHIAERVAVENERCKYSAESAAESNTLVEGGEGNGGTCRHVYKADAEGDHDPAKGAVGGGRRVSEAAT